MKIILFLLGLMIGGFAFGQSLNDLITKEYNLPEFFPEDSLIKCKKIKTIIQFIYYDNETEGKMKFIYDSIGRISEKIEYHWYEPEMIENYSKYSYDSNFKMEVEYHRSSDSLPLIEANKVNYYNIKHQDSIHIDSNYFKRNPYCFFKQYSEYYPVNNLLKKTTAIWNKDSSDLKQYPRKLITEYFYDSLNRNTKIKYTDSSNKGTYNSYTNIKYKGHNLFIGITGDNFNNENKKLYFDNNNNLIKVDNRDMEGGHFYSLSYKNKNIFRIKDDDGETINYIYQNGLPLKAIFSGNFRKDVIKEYRYEFY